MTTRIRQFIKGLLVSCNIIVAIVFLLACLAPYFNPEKWWLLFFLSLGLPVLLVVLFLFLLFWLFVKRKFVFISLIAMLIGWKSISVLFAVHPQVKFNYRKKVDELRILTWNVARFVEFKKVNNEGSEKRVQMMKLIKQQNADVLCLQEIHTSISPAYYNNIEYIQKELGYSYFYFTYEPDTKDHWYSSIIFSRFPILDTGRVYYPGQNTKAKEVLLHADIKFNNDTIRIFTTHLQSVLFRKSDYDRIEKLQHGDEGFVDNSKGILSKLKKGAIIRAGQANTVKGELQQSPYPILFTGDLNDVPASYAYSAVRGDMQDVFLKKGLGPGCTFSSLSPTLRIDYIFADKNFSVQQYKRYVRDLSDHYMQVADLKLLNPHPATE